MLLREAGRLNGIPGALFHGRPALSTPLETPWELSRIWTEAELVVVDDSGHKWTATMRDRVIGALERFKYTE
ncbi:hypothetical protein ACTMTU_04775 [Streptomyces sp. OZ13]|uniref:hypothetical protein n=1 Tax=Streptomyces sp. OZ13 TaxID=3452210 RepID=UPI003F8B06EE